MVFEHLSWFRKLKRNWTSEDIGRSTDIILNSRLDHRDSGNPVPRLRVERVDGGLLVAGVEVASSCHRALPISGCIFLVIGTVLTVVAYQGQSSDEDHEPYTETTSTNSRVLGPVCLVIALLMFFAGLVIYLLSKYARKKEQKVCFHCPIHGDFFPLTPVPVSAVKGRKPSMFCAQGCPAAPPEPPACPYGQLLSARNSVSSQGSCPAPKPFIINNSLRCVEYFWPLTTMSSDIASFPASRAPSPTPIYQISECSAALGPKVCTALPEVMLVAPAEDSFEVITHKEEDPINKSVDTNLPLDD